MSVSMSATRTDGSRLWFDVPTSPARWLARFRPELRASLAADAQTFTRRRPLFFLLAALAVAYPIVGSFFHVVDPTIIIGDPLALALRPFWDVAYSESLPFLLAVALIGAYSPALGVLLVGVFAPADMLAAQLSPPELVKLSWQVYPPPILGRLISYSLLWILAVEIPLLGRTAAVAWAKRRRSGQSVAAAPVIRAATTAVAVFLWAMALPWLIQPVFLWSALQRITPWASAPTWSYWWILVIGAAVASLAAATWPRPVGLGLVTRGADGPPARFAGSMASQIARQVVAVGFLGLLLAGVMSDLLEAVILGAGLIVAGPVLTPLLPRMPIPQRLVAAPALVRWLLGMAVGLAVGWAILTLSGAAASSNYLPTVVSIAVAAPLFRLVLSAGPRGPRPVSPQPFVAPSATMLLVAIGMALWLSAPAPAFANDCPSIEELGDCLKQAFGPLGALGLLGAALGGFGLLIGAGGLAGAAAADAIAQSDREIQDDEVFRHIDQSTPPDTKSSPMPPSGPGRRR